MYEAFQRVGRRGKEQWDAFFQRPWSDRSPAEQVGQGILALAFLTTREVIRDRGPLLAAGLAFFSVLAVVPLLSVAASLMAAFGLLDAQSGLYDTIQQLFPDAAAGVASYIEDTVTGSAGALGGIGGVSLLVIGLVLFNAIEHTMTRIWGGSHDRPVVVKVMTFYAVISFGPLLLALSVVQTASAQIYLARFGLNITVLDSLLPLVYALLAFTLLYKVVPNANVNWKAALVGALFSAVVFELAKWGFNLYVTQLVYQTYDRVYGTLALIPIGLIWMYIVWLVVLVGAELSFTFQHLERLLREEGERRRLGTELNLKAPVNPAVILALLARVLRSFEDGQGAVGSRRVAGEVGIDARVVENLLRRLVTLEVLLLAETGKKNGEKLFLPACPPEKISLAMVYNAFWVDLGAPGLGAGLRDEALGYLKEKTGADLLEVSLGAIESGLLAPASVS